MIALFARSNLFIRHGISIENSNYSSIWNGGRDIKSDLKGEEKDGLTLYAFLFLYPGDMSSRKTKPEIRVKSVEFSPTGRS